MVEQERVRSSRRLFSTLLRLPRDRRVLRLCCVIVGSQCITTVFYTYYLKIFLEHFLIPAHWFQISQALYGVWNALNDPIFAFYQDQSSYFADRGKAMRWGALGYAASFMLFWIPWTNGTSQFDGIIVGIHFCVALFLYDAFFSWALLEYCALTAELSVSHETRLALAKWATLAQFCGGAVLLPINWLTESGDNLLALQIACGAVALFAAAAMWYSGCIDYGLAQSEADVRLVEKTPLRATDALRLNWQLLRDPDCVRFMLMNAFTVASMTIDQSFLIIYLDHLVPYLSTATRSLFASVVYLVPPIGTALLAEVAASIGVWRIAMISFVFKAVVGAAMLGVLLSGVGDWLLVDWLALRGYALLGVILIQIMATVSVGMLFNVLGADVIDQDYRRHRRRAPISSMFFGLNGIFCKPAQSIGPMLVVAYLGLYGYGQHTAPAGVVDGTTTTMSSVVVDNSSVPMAMLHVIAGTPIICGIAQFLIFFGYRLRNTHRHATDETSETLQPTSDQVELAES